jgi:ABC-type lipoprotein release transport system permease subunit
MIEKSRLEVVLVTEISENAGWRVFKARLQKLRRVVVKKQIAEELGLKQGDLIEVAVRKVKSEELE